MAEWNHRICERCWFDGTPSEPPLGVFPSGEYRMPSMAADASPGACCFCGGLTLLEIYVRKSQDDVMCQGRHEDLSWSRVQPETTGP